ncbi:MAG: TolC family outer membrane protein [Pseudomonadota bacterium]
MSHPDLLLRRAPTALRAAQRVLGRAAVKGLALTGLLLSATAALAAEATPENDSVAVADASASNAEAVNLLAAYLDAKDNDPVLGQAVASYKATRARVPQARAGLLPAITGNASTAWNEQSFPLPPVQDTNPTSPTFGQFGRIPDLEFNERQWNVELNQPVLNMESWFTYTSSKANLTAAEWELAATEQALVLRVVEAYLNVLRIQDQLDSTVAEEAAVQRQLEQVQQRFDVGLVAITDVLESQAVFDNAVAQRIQAVGDHDIFFETLSTLTGERYAALGRLEETLPVVNPDPIDEQEWVNRALGTNFAIRSVQSQLAAARRTVRARRAAHLPTVSVGARLSHFVSGGQTVFGSGIKIDTTVYSASVNLPIFQGGAIRARAKEAVALAEQTRESLLEQQLTVERDTRNLYRTVATNVVRVGARLKAIKSAQSALEATETGYEVGTRNIVDVLQAQQRLYRSQFDYADSRYAYVNALMALKQVSGVLSEADLNELNGFVTGKDAVTRVKNASLYELPPSP